MKERHPNLKMAIVEKESDMAVHQSGHNSGVIHAGIYYKPGSLKAKLCVQGLDLSYKYFDKKKIPYKKVGKLIVATNKLELERLHDLQQRAIKNKVPDVVFLQGVDAIKKIEPNCVGVAAIWSPHTGIVDWCLVTKHYGQDFKQMGGDIFLNFEVNGFKESREKDYPVLISSTKSEEIKAKYVLTCAGLQSDFIAMMSGCPKSPKIVPFRGEYLVLSPQKQDIVKANIYPVPDPRFPFLGVHVTPRMDGSIWLGPNAVLSFKREGYKWTDINVFELADTLTYSGFMKMSFKYLLPGAREIMKSAFISMQVKELQNFVPSITINDVQRGPSGVRAQALDDNGNLLEDFYFDMEKSSKHPVGTRILHCRNAPSPGATSSLAIAKMISDKMEEVFNIGR
nr:unnamed protein product [Callosobruchus analis]